MTVITIPYLMIHLSRQRYMYVELLKQQQCASIFNICFTLIIFHFTGDYEVLDAPNVTLSGNYTNRYRSYRGVSVPTACPPGSYCPAGTKDAMEYLCLEGTYSNKTSLNNYTQCTACDPGYYCSGQGIMSYSVGNQTNSLIKKLPNGKL